MSFSVSCGELRARVLGPAAVRAAAERGEPALPRAPVGDRALAADGAGVARRGATTRRPRSATTSTSAGYSRPLPAHFLVPLTAALWSTAPGRALEFPAAYAIRFFDNHGMLGFGRFRWRTVTGGSRRLRVGDRGAARAAGCGSARRCARCGARRTASSCAPTTADRAASTRWCVATHADQALALLEDPSEDERRVLGGVRATR